MYFSKAKISLGCMFALIVSCGEEEKKDEQQCAAPTDATVAAALDDVPEGCPPLEGVAPVATQPDQNQGTGTQLPPSGTTETAVICNAPKKRDPNTNTCINMTLADAKDSATCHLLSAKWYGNSCNSNAITCDNENKTDGSGEACIPKVAADWTTYADCSGHDGYWYDPTDVNMTDAAGFSGLAPTCHETATESCPASGMIGLGRKADDSIVNQDVTSSYIWKGYSGIVEVLSPLRCFQNLVSLELKSNNFTEIDVRANVALESLDLASTGISSLNVSKNTALTSLNISANAFTAPVNLATLAFLEVLSVGNAGAMTIANVNFAQHLNLRSIGLPGTNLSAFDFATLPANLTELDVSQTGLTSLDLTRFTQLVTVRAVGNYSMTSINLTGLVALEEIVAYNCALTSLNVTGQPSLRHLEIDSNNLSSIDLSQNPLLQVLWLSYNSGIISLDLSANTALNYLHLGGMNVTGALDLSGMVNLYSVDVAGSAWSSVDLTNSLDLYSISLDNMANFALDFTKFHADYLADPYSSLVIEQAKWDVATGPVPAWTGTDWGGGVYYYSP